MSLYSQEKEQEVQIFSLYLKTVFQEEQIIKAALLSFSS